MGEDSGQICVLCVDDEPGFAELTATYLERFDNQFSTSAAESAQEGLDFLAENHVDCIVSDYNMPGMDGLAFLQAIRATHPDLPFILFTGRGSEEIASDAISAGVSDYMQKESGNEQYAILGQRIRNVVYRYRAHTQKQEVETRAATILEASPDAILVSVNNEFVYANAAAVELYDVSGKADLLGRQVLEFIHPDYRDDVELQFQEVESGEKPADHIPRTLLTLEGEELPVEVIARGVMWEGQPGVVAIVRDLAPPDEYIRQQEQYDASFQSALDAMVVVDEEGRYIDANQSACELFGLKKEELLGRSIEEFVHDDFDIEAAWERFQQSERERGTFPLVPADGEHRTVEYAASAEIGEGQHLSILRDVTERSEREEQLQQTTARLEALYENSPDMIDVLDTDGRLLDVNRRFCSELGYTEEELLGRPIWDIDVQVSEDDVDSLLGDFELNERRKFEGAYERKDGSTFPVEVHLLRLNITGTDRFLAISRDISDLKDRERRLELLTEELQEKTRHLDAILECTTRPLFMKAVSGEYLFVNREYQRLFDLQEEDIIGRADHDLHPEKVADEVWANDRQVLETEQPVEREERVIVNGEERIYLSSKVPVYFDDESDEPDAVFGMATDITERKEREQKLELVDTLFEHAEECQFIVDVTDGEFGLSHANTYYKRTVGLSPGEPVTGQTPTELFGEAGGQEILDRYRECVQTRESITYSVEVPVPEEGTVYRTILAPVVTDDEVTYIVGTARNITDHKRREEKLERQNERLDEFAGLVSHDLRNPLKVADGRLELAREDCDSEHLDAIEKSHDRMDALIGNMLELARLGQQVRETEPIDPVDIAEGCWQNVETGEATLVSTDAPSIQGDRSRVQQLLENLIRNAVEHGGEGVTITIGEVDEGFYVEDDGVGISEDDLDEIFESGYSSSDEGTGFGLSIVKQIADAHGWTVEPSTGADGGARFQFTGVHYG